MGIGGRGSGTTRALHFGAGGNSKSLPSFCLWKPRSSLVAAHTVKLTAPPRKREDWNDKLAGAERETGLNITERCRAETEAGKSMASGRATAGPGPSQSTTMQGQD